MCDKPRHVYKRKPSIAALPLYYCGHLMKKTNSEKHFKRFFGELRGTQLFLYIHDAQDTYTEQLDLEQVKSMDLKSPYLTKKVSIFTLTLQTEEVQLKMDNPATGEEWRGYILMMAKKVIPRKLMLLPGQMMQMQEALDQEMRRKNLPMLCPPSLPPRSFPPSASSSPSASESPSASSSSPQTTTVKPKPSSSDTDMPACFFNVTRQEAESMLETNPQFGSIILRPSSEGSYALTLRQLLSSGPVMRNFKVAHTHLGLTIHLDVPVRVHSFSDVLNHFLERTEYRLHPYVEAQVYDTHIGENTAFRQSLCFQHAAPHVSLSRVPPTDGFPAQKCNSFTSNIPQAHVVPMLRSQEPELPADKPEEGEYMVPDDQRSSHLNLKPDTEGELQKNLTLQREAMYADMSRDEEEESFIKASSPKVEWIRQKAAE